MKQSQNLHASTSKPGTARQLRPKPQGFGQFPRYFSPVLLKHSSTVSHKVLEKCLELESPGGVSLLLHNMDSILRESLKSVISCYTYTTTALIPGGVRATRRCRYWPSCSQYAQEALSVFTILGAVSLIITRLWRCRPGQGKGYDPIPVGERLV